MKKELMMLAAVLVLAACEKPGNDPVTPATPEVKIPVHIVPVMTKVSETAFEAGDMIGVTISRSSGSYASNAALTYNGSEFAGELYWYAEGAEGATVSAYYPYAAEVPTAFTVETDQSEGTSKSDFVAGSKEGVLPSASAVVLPFKHKLSRILLKVTNNAEGDLAGITLGGAKLTAAIDADFNAAADPASEDGTIKAFKVEDGTYAVVLPPQTVALVASVETAGGNVLAQVLEEAELTAGKQYVINMIVNPKDLVVAFAGEIEDWENGGEIGSGDNTLIEQLDKGFITYHEAKYTVAKMKDGKWWMTQNLRYVPEGITVSDNLSAVTAGVFYPIVVNEGQTAAEFSKDITVINAKGYLYQAEVALGLKVGDLTSVAQAEALESAQGICPKGWHVPTIGDITGLVGKAVSPIATNAEAPYYDGNNGSIPLLNADGFNMEAYGAISIADNTKTAGTFMGFLAAYKEHIATGMFCGSSYAGVTYNTNGDPDSGVKNLQFYGFMPMTNKATEAEYTCNGTKVSYRIAAPLRCVRD